MQRRYGRILIVDEDRAHREMLKAALAPLNVSLDFAEIGAETCMPAGRGHGPPPSIIMVNVPESSFNGASTLAAMRLLHPDTPMIVMASDPTVLQVAMSSDFQLPHFAPRDILPDTLRQLIGSILTNPVEPETPSGDEASREGAPVGAEAGIPLPSLVRLRTLFPGCEVRIASEGR